MQSEATFKQPVWGGCFLLPSITAFTLEEDLEQTRQRHQVRSKIEEGSKKCKETESPV